MRILIVRLSHLGDVVCSVGMLHALHTAFPGAEIGWAIQAEYSELVQGLRGLSRTFRLDRRGGMRAMLALRRELRDFAPDLSVDTQGNLKSALVGLLAGAPRRAGFARADWQEPFGALTLNDLAPAAESRHPVARMRGLAAHVAPGGVFQTGLDFSPAESEAGREQFHRLLPSAEGDGGPVLLHLSSPGDIRSWPLDHWEELARHLLNAGRSVLCLSGPAEQGAGRELEARLGNGLAGSSPGEHHARLAHWAGQKGLRELAALFHAADERSGVLVACDSGPMHLAWASGLRTVVLEGPQSAARTGPWLPPGEPGSPHLELRAESPPTCAPCIARRCAHRLGPLCMEHLTPLRVFSALESLL